MINKFWRALVSNRIVWGICAVIGAFILWRYVITELNPTKSVNLTFNIEYAGESQIYERNKLKVSSETIKQVEMRVTGSYSDVAKIEDNLTLTIDLTSITAAGEYNLKFTYPTSITSSTLSVTTSTGKTTLPVYIVEMSEKTVDVVYNGEIHVSADDGYVADTAKIDPEQVTVSGPIDIIETIDHARPAEITISEKLTSTKSYDRPIELVDTNDNAIEDTSDITLSSETVQVTIPIKYEKEVELTVSLTYGGGATETNVDCVIEPSTVIIDGDAETLSSIEEISLGTIDLATVDSEHEQTFEIKYQEGVGGTVKEANVKISIKDVTTKDFTISNSNLSARNVPEGYSYEIQTKELTVTLRGDADLLESLDAANVRAIADLSTVTSEGAVSQTVEIRVDGENYASVGAIKKETNKITILLTKE